MLSNVKLSYRRVEMSEYDELKKKLDEESPQYTSDE